MSGWRVVMANRKSEKVTISRDCFLRIIREKGYTVERLGEAPEVDRSAKTIQRCLSDNEMAPDLLDRIARLLDVDPEYLAGVYDRRFEDAKDELPNPELTKYLWTKTDRFPYSKHETNNIDYRQFLLNALRVSGISKEQFLNLSPEKRRSLQFDIGTALRKAITPYFDTDSNGSPIGCSALAEEGFTLLMGAWIKE